MPARRATRRSRSPARGGPRRQTTWENLCIEFAHGTIGETVIFDLTPEPMATALVGTATLIRSIMNLWYNIDGAGSNNTTQQVALGITVMTNDAFAAGAVPDPLTGDFQQAWYYWTCLQLTHAAAAAPVTEREVDIRTARKPRGGFKLVAITESISTNDIDTVLFLGMRNLWQVTS